MSSDAPIRGFTDSPITIITQKTLADIPMLSEEENVLNGVKKEQDERKTLQGIEASA